MSTNMCQLRGHVEDNQGLCHYCGRLLDRGNWEAYAGSGVKSSYDTDLRELLILLRTPLMMKSKPDRERAYEIAARYSVTAADLLDVTHDALRNK